MEVCRLEIPTRAGTKAIFDPKRQDLDMSEGFGREGIVVSLYDGLGEPSDRRVREVWIDPGGWARV